MMKSGVLYRSLCGIVSFLAVSAFTLVGNVSKAQMVSASQIYAYAKANNTNALYRLYGYLDTQDSRGNTALCMAVMDDNLQAYNLLKQFGANTQPRCLSAALAGGGSSSTFLGMGTTGWIVTGAVVAGGVGIAAAAGGGGGGGGGDTPSKCVHGKMVDDKCVCDEGWTSSDCSKPFDCGTGYKVSCSADEYTDGQTCKSGDTTMKKCIPHSPMPNCEVLSDYDDICLVCKDGWTGNKCESVVSCGEGYKTECAANEYTNGQTCKSGDATLKKCIVHSVMPNCDVFKTDEDACLVCKDGWIGKKCETEKDCGENYKALCAQNEYSVAGDTCKSGEQTLLRCKAHTVMPNCAEYRTDEDTCKTCKEGWTSTDCSTPSSCSTDYALTCGDGFYVDEEDTCKSGDATLKKCLPHTPVENCDIYSPTEDKCEICVSGWTGDTCETPAECGLGYKEACEVNEYSVAGDTCDSGGKVLKKCEAHSEMPNCDVFKTTEDKCDTCKSGWTGDTCNTANECGTGYKLYCNGSEYTDGSTCPHGDEVWKKCIEHTSMPNCEELDPNDDKCLTCKEGWIGDMCTEADECSGYKKSCSDGEYSVAGDTCPHGDEVWKKCAPLTPVEHCNVYSTTEDKCAVCNLGWVGDDCSQKNSCEPKFKDECNPDQYATGEICPYGDETLIECADHTPMENCNVYSTTEDKCAECKSGWTGDTCEEESTCPPQYKKSCLDSEYVVESDTCESGGELLSKCEPHSDIDNCEVYSTTSDTCATCAEGWTGETCETPAECPGNYRSVCGYDEYQGAGVCITGGETLVECISHSPMPNCDEYSPDEDICLTCKEGWEGETCEDATYCGDGYKETCTEGEEYTISTSSCPSGGKVLKKCVGYTPMPNCIELDPFDDKCSNCKQGWTGDKCDTKNTCTADYKEECDEGEYMPGPTCPYGDEQLVQCVAHTPLDNCKTYSDYEDICLSCKEGWIGETCEEPVDCGEGYRLECKEDEYEDALSTCHSGGNLLKRCEKHTEIDNCEVYSTTSDTCATCAEGWIGEYCYIPYDCGDDFKVECDDNEYVDSSVPACKSGFETRVKCTMHSIMPNCEVLSTTDDVCVTCREGWTGSKCENENPCEGYSSSCGDDEYEVIGDKCKKGNTSLIKCEKHTEMPNCDLLSSTSDTCDQCKEGWAGLQCTVESTCGSSYKEACPSYEYVKFDDTCSAGDLTLYKCTSYSDMPHCVLKNPFDDACLVCEKGWEGSKCNTPSELENDTDISILNSESDAYGLTDSDLCVFTNSKQGTILITGTQGDEAVGIDQKRYFSESKVNNSGKITIISSAHNAYGIRSKAGIVTNESKGTISISGTGNYAYGIYAGSNVQNAANEGQISLDSNGVSYGIYAEPDATISNENGGEINISNGTGTAYGMYATNADEETTNFVMNSGAITITGTADAYGIRSKAGIVTNESTGVISISGAENNAYGIHVGGFVIEADNEGQISLDSNGVSYGMYAESGTAITNGFGGKINISNGDGTSYGMYAEDGEVGNHTMVVNYGSITITNTADAYGIYSAGPNVTIRNTGTISLNGSSCSGADCKDDDRFIKLNGATFEQSGSMMADVIKLDSYGGDVVASNTSYFEAEDISGNLIMSSNVVKEGFEDTYTVKNMVSADNTAGLNLQSQSALFDATLENNSDAVLKMKAFEDVVENKSLAEFLKQNYESGNNESLYNELKDQKTAAALNDTIRELTGSDIFNRFTFEDLTMIRELNMDMNNTLFTNEEKHFEVSGSVTPLNFDGNSGSNARYALYNNRSGRKSFGLGVAFTDVRSDSGKDNKDRRYDQTFQVSAPMGYRRNGFRFVTSPRLGYAYGTYDRDGYQGKKYDGKIEKRMFGLMNEVRYPVSMGKWSVAPAAEFNMLGYNIKGREDARRNYSLNIRSQNNYSVESGLGLYANRDFKHGTKGLLKFNIGMAIYHEFADPYSLDLQMRGMDGSYKVRDDRRKDNRAVIRTGFDYKWSDDIMFTGSFASYLDGTTHNNANLDFKHKF